MYAILVNEPGADVEHYVLPTGTRTPEQAMQLMSSRAEEFVSEELELQPEKAEGYHTEVNHEQLWITITDPTQEEGEEVVIQFSAEHVEVV